MALSPDQQAMLQLLLERGQSYADLADLLGGDEASVRTRARAALEQLAGADPDRNVSLTDYLLGQADPIGRADAVRHLRDDSEDLELARELSQKLLLLAPQAQLPKLPGERALGDGAGRTLPRPPGISLPRIGRTGLSARQGRLLAALASGAVILLVVTLAIAGVFSGGGDGTAAGTDTTTTSTAGVGENAVRVTLTPQQQDSNASGTAVFATANRQPFMELQVTGLPEPPPGQAYVAWLLFNDKVGHPLSPVANSDGTFPASGNVHLTAPLSDFQVPIAQRAKFVDVSLSDAADLTKALNAALKNTTPIIRYEGTSVLRGTIPRTSDQSSG